MAAEKQDLLQVVQSQVISPKCRHEHHKMDSVGYMYTYISICVYVCMYITIIIIKKVMTLRRNGEILMELDGEQN